jgi:hypothetical protein
MITLLDFDSKDQILVYDTESMRFLLAPIYITWDKFLIHKKTVLIHNLYTSFCTKRL